MSQAMPALPETPLRVLRLDGLLARFRGLLGKPSPGPGEAVRLIPCRQVHTFGMAYAIDVAHLDAGGTILAVATLKPWRMSRWILRAASVLELKAGEAARLGLIVGAKPTLIEVPARASRNGLGF
jgi:uncharacterized protein